MKTFHNTGCSASDFPDQINGGLDQSLFTLIVIDLPGYGKSRPPERDYKKQLYQSDAAVAAALMDKLGYKLYSIMGWSDGAKVALWMAAKYQGRVEKLILFGIVPYASEHDINAVGRTRNANTVFDPKSRDLYRRAYGQELFEKLWHNHVDFYVTWINDPLSYWNAKEEMKTIKCPTLILHGDKDPFIHKAHPEETERAIADSRLYRFPKGSHNIHMTHSQEFNKVVTDFLLE